MYSMEKYPRINRINKLEVTKMIKLMFSSLILMLLLFGCGSQSDHETETEGGGEMKTASKEFQGQLTEMVIVYLGLKDALVKGKADVAFQKGKLLREVLSKVDRNLVPGAVPDDWKKKQQELLDKIVNITSQDEIMGLRAAFLPLSESLISIVKEYGPLNITLYVQHCPMAFDNTGGDWLSDSDTVFNPYFGNMMLHCGWVADTLAMN
jgi:Cu(I)/Ag(I) efflux system membrane fusion protein